MYSVIKTYGHERGLSCAFRQHAARSHCNLIHGYALAIEITFVAEELDEQNWVIDFGDLKPLELKLKAMYDHKTVVAKDDPKLAIFEQLEAEDMIELRIAERVGCEAFAKEVHDVTSQFLLDNKHLRNRVFVLRVKVSEHGANSAAYVGVTA